MLVFYMVQLMPDCKVPFFLCELFHICGQTNNREKIAECKWRAKIFRFNKLYILFYLQFSSEFIKFFSCSSSTFAENLLSILLHKKYLITYIEVNIIAINPEPKHHIQARMVTISIIKSIWLYM